MADRKTTIRKKRAAEVISLLKEEYPEVECALIYSQPHELLIATRLSAQCTDKRVNMVTPALFQRFKSIDEFAAAEVSEVEEYIRTCGLFKTKAKDIVEMCIMLRDVYQAPRRRQKDREPDCRRPLWKARAGVRHSCDTAHQPSGTGGFHRRRDR